MLKDTLIELREQIGRAVESGRDEDLLRLREDLERVLMKMGREDQGFHDEDHGWRKGFEAVTDAWLRGVSPAGMEEALIGRDGPVAVLIGDMLSVQQFALALSNGDLSKPLKVKGVMAGSLKALQSNLRHLTWQTQAIAKGDFSQRVDFMGDFSESFNHMVTSLAEMREALEESKREIEQRVEERTVELRNACGRLQAESEERERVEEELRHVQKMEALGTFCGGIAHDFNNILAGIIGFTEMVLEETHEDSPVRRKLELILKSAVRGREMVKQILTFSRRAKVEKRQVSMKAMIEESMNLLRPVLSPAVEVRRGFRGKRDTIDADRVQIHQILVNLVTNAAHAMGEKGGVLEVTLADADFDEARARGLGVKPGAYVELSVKDTGHGIPGHLQKKIFDPFFTTKRSGQGTGMGLSVVHGIVKGHEGAVTVESEPDKGSTFRVFLPAGGAGNMVEGAAAAREEKGDGERILFVDDEETLVEMNMARLVSMGYRVTGETDPRQAVKTFQAEPGAFDLVITDYSMPAMTGLDLARALHEIDPRVPVVLCSGIDESPGPRVLKEAHIRAFTGKAVGKRELAETVRKALGK